MTKRVIEIFKLTTLLRIGKYKGENIKWIIDNDSSYLLWLMERKHEMMLDDKATDYLLEANNYDYNLKRKK